jgi:hypothetical protein
MDRGTYDYRRCESLFGYSASVHERSGGVCQLCGAGDGEPDFDLWRELTVEHLIGSSQGGYPLEIHAAVAVRFPSLDLEQQAALAARIDAANTITACGFCNSTTSRDKADKTMQELVAAPAESPEELYTSIEAFCFAILERKRQDVAWKLDGIRAAYQRLVLPKVLDARGLAEGAAPSHYEVGRGFQEVAAGVLAKELGEPLHMEVEMRIGTPPRSHKFDLASRSRRFVVECKAYTWTQSGNIPSAKISHLREAVGYLNELPEATTRVLAVARADHPTKSETLGRYFVRLNAQILGSVTVVEIADDGTYSVLHGDAGVFASRTKSLGRP